MVTVLGVTGARRKFTQSFYWPFMHRDCWLFMEMCAVCHLNKVGRSQQASLLHYQAGVPIERAHLDILGPFTTSESGNTYVLMIVDQFTHWLELHALNELTAELTVRTFFQQWVTKFGTPLQVHTDQDTLLEVKKTRTTPYLPSSDGPVLYQVLSSR